MGQTGDSALRCRCYPSPAGTSEPLDPLLLVPACWSSLTERTVEGRREVNLNLLKFDPCWTRLRGEGRDTYTPCTFLPTVGQQPALDRVPPQDIGLLNWRANTRGEHWDGDSTSFFPSRVRAVSARHSAPRMAHMGRLRLWYDVYAQLIELRCDVNVHVPDTVFVSAGGELMGWFRSAQRKLERVDTEPNFGSVLHTFFTVRRLDEARSSLRRCPAHTNLLFTAPPFDLLPPRFIPTSHAPLLNPLLPVPLSPRFYVSTSHHHFASPLRVPLRVSPLRASPCSPHPTSSLHHLCTPRPHRSCTDLRRRSWTAGQCVCSAVATSAPA